MHLLCPHCRSPIELTALARGGEVSCPSCGSTFHLEGESTGPFDPRTGQSFGKFELVETVGQGAFGTVYRARDRELDRVVAVKVPRAALLPGSQELDRFLREARSAAQLRHPSIVPVYEVGQAGETPYLVSQFVEGVTLADRLTDRRPGFREAAGLVAAVADALQYAHEHGVVHRDVKPSNIMLDTTGTPFVMDFGLAKRDAGEMTMTIEGQVLGTPAYMSPEQARGEAHGVDGRSDVYSMGVVLYQLLTGELPFRGNTRMLLHHVLHDEPRPPRSLNDHVPRDLETVCLKAMAKEPARRYATAGELADDLRRYLAGEPIKARPVGALERAWVWTKRRPAAAGLLLASAVAALALVGVAVGAVFYGQLREANQRAANALEEARQNLEKAERTQYFLQIDQADRNWWANNAGRTREILAGILPERRRWEWYYLNRLSRSELRAPLTGHEGLISCVAWSADGAFLATVSHDKTVRIWDPNTGRQLCRLPDHKSFVESVAFSPNGRWLASASGTQSNPMIPGVVIVWELRPRGGPGQELEVKEVRRIPGRTGERAQVAFSPDSDYLAIAPGTMEPPLKVSLYSVPGWEEVANRFPPLQVPGLLGVAFSRNGTLAVSTGSIPDAGYYRPEPGTILLYDFRTGKHLTTLRGHAQGVISVAFSPDGARLASTSFDKRAKVWDPHTFKEVSTLKGHTAAVIRVAFRRGGQQLATASEDGSVKVWEVETGEEVLTLRGHASEVYGVAYDHDGRRLASAGMDGVVRIWDATAPQEARVLGGHSRTIHSVAFSPDGRLASASDDRTIRLWDPRTASLVRVLATLEQPINCLAFSPDGARIVAGCGQWNMVGQQGQLVLLDAATGTVLYKRDAHPRIVWSVAFDRRGERIVSSGGETQSAGGVKVWQTSAGQQLTGIARSTGVTRAVFSPDSRSIAGALFMDSAVQTWDASTLEERPALSLAPIWPKALVYTPDGKRILGGGVGGSAIRVWDAATGEVLPPLLGHTSDIYGLAFAPDGQRLATSSYDQTVKLWDVATGRDVLTLRGHTLGVRSVAFSHDGHWVASGGDDRTVRLWDGRPPAEVEARRR